MKDKIISRKKLINEWKLGHYLYYLLFVLTPSFNDNTKKTKVSQAYQINVAKENCLLNNRHL